MLTKLNPKTRRRISEIANELVVLKHELGTLGLLKTMHAMEPAVQAIGWELAEIIEVEGPDALKEK